MKTNEEAIPFHSIYVKPLSKSNRTKMNQMPTVNRDSVYYPFSNDIIARNVQRTIEGSQSRIDFDGHI